LSCDERHRNTAGHDCDAACGHGSDTANSAGYAWIDLAQRNDSNHTAERDHSRSDARSKLAATSGKHDPTQ